MVAIGVECNGQWLLSEIPHLLTHLGGIIPNTEGAVRAARCQCGLANAHIETVHSTMVEPTRELGN